MRNNITVADIFLPTALARISKESSFVGILHPHFISAPDENKSSLLGKNPVKQKNNHFDFVSMFISLRIGGAYFLCICCLYHNKSIAIHLCFIVEICVWAILVLALITLIVPPPESHTKPPPLQIQDILDRGERKHGIDTIQNIFYQKKK